MKTSSRIIFFLSLIGLTLLTAPEQLYAQEFVIDQSFVLDNWTVHDGLPINSITSITQSNDGYLWLASYDGLVRFDGVRFKVYQTEEYPSLPTNRIVNVREGKDGSLWMDTEQGYLVKFDHVKFKRLTSKDGLNGEEVTILHKDRNGNIWVGTNRGISVYDGKKFAPFAPDVINQGVYRIYVQKSGVLWFTDSSNGFLFRYENGSVESLNPENKKYGISSLSEDDSGTVWVGLNSSLYSYQEGKLSLFHTFPPETGGISSAVKREDGTILVQLNYFYVYENNKWRKISSRLRMHRSMTTFYELENDIWMIASNKVMFNETEILQLPQQIYTNYLDREGNLWLGTINKGLVRLKKNPFKTFSKPEGLASKNVYPLLEDKDGTIWVGTYGSGISKIKNGQVIGTEFLNPKDTTGYFTSLYQAANGSIFAGRLGYGLMEMKEGEQEFSSFRTSNPEAPITTNSIYEDKDETIWFGSLDGLFQKRESTVTQVDTAGVGLIDKVRFFFNAPDRSFWMATNGSGIINYKEGEFSFYNEENGFPSNLIRSLYIVPNADNKSYVLWVGSENRGLFRVEVEDGIPKLKTMTNYSIKQGLPDYSIHIILADEFENFWLNTNKGIYRVSKQELEAFHQGEITELKGVTYTESDGLRNREGNGGMQPAGLIDSKEKFWLPTQDGVVTFDPAELINTENKAVPPVVVEEIETKSRIVLPNSSRINLEVDERDFEVRFTALSFVSPKKNKFRYRLSGFNNTWQETNGDRSVNYTNVPNGTYTFEVMGSNNTGTWNPKPTVLTIVVDAYFYESIWFKLLVLSSVLGLFFIGFRWRISSLKRSEQKLKKLVLERTSLLEKEKAKTEQQAEELKNLDVAKSRFFTNISHELRTPLTLIMSPLQQMLYSESDKFDIKTKRRFERILRNSDRLLRLIDQTLELSKLENGKLSLSVREVNLNSFLKELVQLFKFVADEKGVSISLIHTQPTTVFVDPDKLDKMVANLLSNAIKFTPTKGSIKIMVEEDQKYTYIKVSDTGIGIEEQELSKVFDRFYQVDSSETRFQEGSGIGLSLAKDFAEAHQGKLTVGSVFGEGSTFTLRIKKGNTHFKADDFEGEEKIIYDDNAVLHDSKDEEHPQETEELAADRTTVLVVEDNADMRAFINEILEDTYHIIEAENGTHASELISEKLPDLIIADIMMPKMDGISLNRILKKDMLTASIPLIFLTAKSTKEEVLLGLKEGADAYITKPFNPVLLKTKVKNILESQFRLRKLIGSTSTSDNTEEKQSFDPFLKKINSILSTHYSNPDFSIKQLSELLYLDRSQVLRKLKKLENTTPTEYLKKFRLQKASELLIRGEGNISEIAYATGFKSLSYFSVSFKEFHGLNPSEFVKG